MRQIAHYMLIGLRFLLAAAILVREAIATVGEPLWHWLAEIRLLERLSCWVMTLPPWGVVVAVSTPLALAEPLKAVGIYLMATGSPGLGFFLLALGYAVSLVLAERIMQAGRPQLMTYRWFAIGWAWFERFRAYVLSLPIVRAAHRLAERLIDVSRALRHSLRRFLSRVASR